MWYIYYVHDYVHMKGGNGHDDTDGDKRQE